MLDISGCISLRDLGLYILPREMREESGEGVRLTTGLYTK
jgi:hypothetical protein